VAPSAAHDDVGDRDADRDADVQLDRAPVRPPRETPSAMTAGPGAKTARVQQRGERHAAPAAQRRLQDAQARRARGAAAGARDSGTAA
jgi:hypothetical protein